MGRTGENSQSRDSFRSVRRDSGHCIKFRFETKIYKSYTQEGKKPNTLGTGDFVIQSRTNVVRIGVFLNNFTVKDPRWSESETRVIES